MRDPLPDRTNNQDKRPKEQSTPRWVKVVVAVGVLVLVALALSHHLLGGHIGHAP